MNLNMLMLCYYYPPLNDVGSTRSIAFSKYLKKFGWPPHVVSVKNPDRAYTSLGTDKPPPGISTEYTYSIINFYKLLGKANGLLSRIVKPLGIQIKKNIFYDFIAIPDYFWGWIPLTTIKCYRLIKKLNTGVIYVSCTPFSSAVIGVLLKLLTGKPLVLDFRDPFGVDTLFCPSVPRFRIKLNRLIGDFFVRHADILIVTTEETKEGYLQLYPYAKDKIFTVHNGFDTDYMVRERPTKYQKFTIVYTGDFYFNFIKSKVFFEALALLKSTGKIDSATFQFLLYGEAKDEIDGIARDYGIEDLVVTSSRIPYKDVLLVLYQSHLQLLRIVKPMISTKFFEGIPLNIPFLATIPSGEVEELIKKYSPSSYVITEESADKVADAILDAMTKYRSGLIKDNHVQEFLENFSRENLTLKLIDIMEQKLNVTESKCVPHCVEGYLL